MKSSRVSMDSKESVTNVNAVTGSPSSEGGMSSSLPPVPLLKDFSGARATAALVTTTKKKRKRSFGKKGNSSSSNAASLDSVRNYFSNLDSEKLNVVNKTAPLSPERRGADVVRTIRGVDLTSPGLKEDYEDYKGALSPTLKPMRMDEFANTRARRGLFDLTVE